MKKRKAASSGSASERPATVVNNITINKTINNYFPPQPGPAPAPEAGPVVPPHLFPEGEREVRVPHGNPRYGTYRRVLSTRSGGLFGDCGNCTASGLSIDRFARDECLNNRRLRAAFLEKVEEYNEAYESRDLEAAREAREYLVEERTTKCPPCRTTGNTLTGETKACKEFWIATREAMCLAQNGCRHPACVERGELAKYVLEGDHKDPEGLIDPANKWVHALSDYMWWSWNGGVAAMRAEVAKLQWPCRFCHFLEKTGNAANRNGDPAMLPPGKYNGTEEEIKQYDAKRHATKVYPKQQHVDKEKLRRGCCLQCKRTVTKENVFAFHFDHRNELTKMKGGLAGKSGGVAGLVNNHANAATLDKIEPILDAEMDKCDVLCANCHHRKTYGYPFRA
tara:strand:+ start:1441 stop:2625 length:1185 start_codon:yes stop_codon:yes gene_type:complete